MHSVSCNRTVGGWIAGCWAATGVLCAFALVVSAFGVDGPFSLRFVGAIVALVFPALIVFVATCVLTGIPAAAAIWLSERFRIRSILFFGGVGAAIGGGMPVLLLLALVPPAMPTGSALLFVTLLFAIAGLAAGLTYWRLAGRNAGWEESMDR